MDAKERKEFYRLWYEFYKRYCDQKQRESKKQRNETDSLPDLFKSGMEALGALLREPFIALAIKFGYYPPFYALSKINAPFETYWNDELEHYAKDAHDDAVCVGPSFEEMHTFMNHMHLPKLELLEKMGELGVDGMRCMHNRDWSRGRKNKVLTISIDLSSESSPEELGEYVSSIISKEKKQRKIKKKQRLRLDDLKTYLETYDSWDNEKKASDDISYQNKRRYYRKAKKIISNVGNGLFPGDYQ